jgi:hypothetical protein
MSVRLVYPFDIFGRLWIDYQSKLKVILGMNDARRYQRYTVDYNVDSHAQFEVKLEGESVHLVNFSVGDLYVLSKVPFSQGPIKISVAFKNGGEIAMPGNVVRGTKEGDMWGIAIDLSNIYELNSARKV